MKGSDMNEKIKQPTQTRPVGSDMTMDEILSSIRKIISTEDHLQSEPVSKAAMPNITEKKETPKIRVPLSSKEQLKSLSTPLTDDMNMVAQDWQSQTKTETPQEAPKQGGDFTINPASLYNETVMEFAPQATPLMQTTPPQQSDETSEILKTLEEIRKSLSAESLQKASGIMQDNPENEQPPMIDKTQEVTIDNAEINAPSQIQNIDFKPVHFGQDDIPEFLKKFKKEQSEPQNPIPPETTSSYNFKEIQSFEDDDAIMELTEALKDPVSLNTMADKMALEIAPPKETTPKAIKEQAVEDDDMSDVLEMLMIKSLRPMLKEWVEDNIADIAQKVLREELQKRGQKNKA